MSYRIHPVDRASKVAIFADLLTGIPKEEIAELLQEAERELFLREFGRNESSRKSKLGDPYLRENGLITAFSPTYRCW